MGNQPSTPARVVRTLDPAQVEKMGSAARFYQLNGPRFKKRAEANRLTPLQRDFRDGFFRASLLVGSRPSAALLRSASFRSTGMPCLRNRSANASSASSWK